MVYDVVWRNVSFLVRYPICSEHRLILPVEVKLVGFVQSPVRFMDMHAWWSQAILPSSTSILITVHAVATKVMALAVQVLQLLQPSMYLVVSIKTKHKVAQASLSGSISIGLLSLCLLTYHQSWSGALQLSQFASWTHTCSGALQLSQSASWTHTDARSICIDASSAKWRHFACSMKKLTMELSLNRYRVKNFWILEKIDNGTVSQPLHCQIWLQIITTVITIATDHHGWISRVSILIRYYWSLQIWVQVCATIMDNFLDNVFYNYSLSIIIISTYN
jgi:hypothetical protein